MAATTTRRNFFKVAASAVTFSSGLGLLLSKSALAAQRTTSKPPLRITEIERHEVVLPFNDYNATTLYRCQGSGLMTRTIFVAKTNVGIEGYGEGLGAAWLPPAELEPYIGTSPFDWVGHDTHLPLSMVFYDLMGKYLGLPAWKLIGPKVRSWVPVSAWTEPQTPGAMAEEVRQAVRRGYHWLKFHVNQCQDVVDQTEAMQKVAPPGFKVHYDFNADSNLEAISPVLKELERFPIAARAEDPVVPTDHDAYRLLRQESRLSILLHHAPMEVMTKNVCDGYMAGHASIGVAARAAAIAEATNTPFMLQQAGGTINLAFLAHEVAVFKMAVLDHVHLANLWKDDVTQERFSVVGGSIAVPKGPGLGVTLDREKLEKYKKAPAPTPVRLLVRVEYKNGLTILFRHNPEESGALLNLRSLARVNLPGPVPGYRNRVVTKFWEADGTAEFNRAWEKTESGPYWIPSERFPRKSGTP
jgi:L-alanine-DL-glutamate epimerase-like enolase superfamily enzyme